MLKRNHPQETPSKILNIGHYVFLPVQQKLWFRKQLISTLSYRENKLLQLLAQRKGEVLDRKTCLFQLWGDDSFFQVRTIDDLYISKLPKNFTQDKSIEIINIREAGLKLAVNANSREVRK